MEVLRNKVMFKHDNMVINADIMKELYKDVCDKVVKHLCSIFDKVEVADVDRILMEGGFSESEMLQGGVKSNFPDKCIVIPNESGLTVPKGAVSFAFYPTFISTRISAYTYGEQAYKHFEPALHSKDKRHEMKQGNETFILYRDCFCIHARIGELMKNRDSRGRHEYVPNTKDDKLLVYVYRSTDPFLLYTDVDGVKKVGDIEVTFQDKSDAISRPVTVETIFGDTELEVVPVEKSSDDEQGNQNKRKAYFDCLKSDESAKMRHYLETDNES